MKQCTVCGEEKSFDEFYNMSASRDGKGYRCKSCDNAARKEYHATRDPDVLRKIARKKNLKHKYNITPEDYDRMLLEQGGGCAICGTTDPECHMGNHKTSYFAVDHDHTTGTVRGLLCNSCNRGLGFLGDTKENLLAAYKYLETH